MLPVRQPLLCSGHSAAATALCTTRCVSVTCKTMRCLHGAAAADLAVPWPAADPAVPWPAADLAVPWPAADPAVPWPAADPAVPWPTADPAVPWPSPQALKANAEGAVKDLRLNNNYITRFGQVALSEAVDMVFEMGGGKVTTVHL